jgi:hypothetical protein
MGLYNIVNQASLVAGQPEDIGQVLANFVAIQAVLNGGIDDVNIRTTAAINPSKLLGYPSDPNKFLRGDGLWGTRAIASAISGGPPAGAVDGDIWIATGVGANGENWQFRYNAGSSSAYKWEFIGGPDLESGPQGSLTTSAVAQVDLTGGPTIAIPRAGDYIVEIGAIHQSAAGQGETINQIKGSVVGVLGTPTLQILMAGVAYYQMNSTKVRLNALAAQTINLVCQIATVSISATFSNGYIAVTPVRVS